MTERSRQVEEPLDPIVMVQNSISWIDGITVEVKRELEEIKEWRSSVKPHGGVMSRKEREIHHLEVRLSDLRHLDKNFKDILKALKSTKKPTVEQE